MARTLIGLGNPGKEYEHTRHNVGHYMIDRLRAVGEIQSVKTDTFMNHSGDFVLRWMNTHIVSLDEIVIIHDDWAFDVGEYRLQFGRGHNNHNGVRHIQNVLGSKEFWRLRIGIGVCPPSVDPSEYVLQQLSTSDMSAISSLAPNIYSELLSLANHG